MAVGRGGRPRRVDPRTLAHASQAAAERLSLPELHDEDSPLPVGWVVAERSSAPDSRSVEDHLLAAAEALEQGVPAQVAELPQVQQQVQRLRLLVSMELGGFSLCVWT